MNDNVRFYGLCFLLKSKAIVLNIGTVTVVTNHYGSETTPPLCQPAGQPSKCTKVNFLKIYKGRMLPF